LAFTEPYTLELGFVSDETTTPLYRGGGILQQLTPEGNHSEVFGVSVTTTINLQMAADSSEAPPPNGPGSGPDWIEPPGGWPPSQWVYGVAINNLSDKTINLGSYAAPFGDTEVPGLSIFQRRPTTYFRIQADGGGRQMMYAAYGDDSPRRFFELWKDGTRFSFLGLPDPCVQLRSPSGIITTRPVTVHGRAYGRFSADFGELNELGDWKVQVRFVEESDSLGAFVGDAGPSMPGPLPPPQAVGELWRALHKPLILRVCAGAEEIW
jgi:hypothetical protein